MARKALLVGTGTYIEGTGKKKGLPNLQTPVHNINRLRQALEDSRLGAFEQVFVLPDKSVQEIKIEIAEFFMEADAEDVLLLYYTGHGHPRPGSAEHVCLAGVDTPAYDPSIHCIEKSFVYDKVEQTQARSIILLIDCCFSGAFAINPKYRSSQHLEVITSAGPIEYAFEPTSGEGGILSYFSEALIQAIREGAACDALQEYLTVKDTGKYLQSCLTISGHRVTPRYFNSSSSDSLLLARNVLYHTIPEKIRRHLSLGTEAQQTAAIAFLRDQYRRAQDAGFIKLLENALEGLTDHSREAVKVAAREALSWKQTGWYVQPTGDTAHVTDVALLYLNWLIGEHAYLKLSGIHSEKTVQGVELENVYVALRGEKSSSYERLKARDLSRQFATSAGATNAMAGEPDELELIQENPLMPSIVERDRVPAEFDVPITLGEAFRDERFLVILGDPGSGKTTLSRWLALQLARAYKKVLETGEKEYVMVEEHKVDPYLDAEDVLFDLGPSRLPVFISISDYAQSYQEATKRNGERPSLIDYLGKHKWEGKYPSYPDERPLDPTDLKTTFQYFLRKGEAVFILDGMDEVTDYRKEIVAEIEAFIGKWIIHKGKGGEPSREDWRKYNHPPGRNGGNQIIISSRIVGYHLHPISNSVTHVTIEPMKPKAIERFCHMWMRERYRTEHHSQPDKMVGELADNAAKWLTAAIFRDEKIRELAGNPLLITIIALVFEKSKGEQIDMDQQALPRQRAKLYEDALMTLIKTWKTHNLTADEVTYVLAAVASTIHINYPKGIILESELRTIIKASLIRYYHPEQLPPGFQNNVDTFVNEVKNKVGILAPRGHEAFGFIHLTFQEYLAARYIIYNNQKEIPEVADYLDHPRWNVPLTMALGHISIDINWDIPAVNRVLTSILESDVGLSEYFPRTALLLSHAFNEMALEKVGDDVIEKVIVKLVEAYSNRARLSQYPELKKRIEKGLVNIRKSGKFHLIENVFCKLLEKPPAGSPQLASAVAAIALHNRWFSAAIVENLFKALIYDSADWDWIISNTLVKLSSPQMAIVQPEEPPLPESPKKRFEKEVEQYRTELKSLQSGKFLSALHGSVNKLLKQQLPLSILRAELRAMYIVVARHAALIRLLNVLIKQVGDGKLKRVLGRRNIKARQSFREAWQQYDAEGMEDWHVITSMIKAALLQVTLQGCLSRLKKWRAQTRQLLREQTVVISRAEEALGKLMNKKELNAYKRDVLQTRSKPPVRLPLSLNKMDKDWRQFLILCHLIVHEPDWTTLADINPLVPVKSCDKLLDELNKYQEDLAQVHNKLKHREILYKINEKRRIIQEDTQLYMVYREERTRYNYARQYYEEMLERYQNQQMSTPILPWGPQYEKGFEPKSFKEHVLYILFWGGYAYNRCIEVDEAKKEVQQFLQKDQEEQQQLINESPAYYYGRYGYINLIESMTKSLQDIRVSLDDLNRVNINDALSDPVLERKLIYRSCCTGRSRLLDVYRQNDLQRLGWSTGQEDKWEAIDGTIALLLKKPNAREAISLIEHSPYLQEIIRKLTAIRKTMEDMVFRSEGLVEEACIRNVKFMDPFKWWMVYDKLHSCILQVKKDAYPSKRLIDLCPDDYRSLLLSDMLHVIHHFRGQPRNKAHSLIAGYITSAWAIELRDALAQMSEPGIPIWDRQSALPPELFNAIGILRQRQGEDAEEYKALTEQCVNALMEHIVTEEHDQWVELILLCAQYRLFGNGLERFLPVESRHPVYLVNNLLPVILTIKEPYYRARALIRILLMGQNVKGLKYRIQNTIEEVQDPFHKGQLLLLLGHHQHLSGNLKEYIDQLYQLMDTIGDPLQRIKLALDGQALFSFDKTGRLCNVLKVAFTEIQDLSIKARIARLLYKKKPDEQFHAWLEKELLTNSNEIVFIMGHDLFGLELLLDKDRLAVQKKSPDKWAPLLLYAGLGDLINYFSSSSGNVSIDSLWNSFAEAPSEENAAALYDVGIEYGLELNKQTVDRIDQIYEQGNVALLRPLLPLLQLADATTLPVIDRWIDGKEGLLAQYACLYHGEYYKRVNERNIDGLLALSLVGESRTCCRLNILFCNGVTMARRAHPKLYSLSEWTQPLMEKITGKVNQQEHLSVRHSLMHMIFYDLGLDHSGLLQTCLSDRFYARFFRNAHDLTVVAERQLADYITDHPPDEVIDNQMMYLLIQSYCEYGYNNGRVFCELAKSLAEKRPAIAERFKFMPYGINDLMEVLIANGPDNVAQCIAALERRMSPILFIQTDEALERYARTIEEGLAPAYGFHYYDQFVFKHDRQMRRVAGHYTEELYMLLIKCLLETGGASSENILDNRRELMAIVLAIWTDQRNISILNSFNTEGQLYKTFLEIFKEAHIAGKLAIINLLRFIDRHTGDGIRLLINELNGYPLLERAAIHTLNCIRRVDDPIIDLLFEKTKEENTLVANICVTILTGYANDGDVKPAIRKRIQQHLVGLLKDPSKKAGIYRYSTAEGSVDAPIGVRYAGRLDEMIFKAMLRIMDK